MVLGVYSDDNGVPDANLAVTDTTAIDANPGWQTVQLTSPVDVNEGDTIWLAWVFETNPGTHYRAVYPTARYASGSSFEDGMPSDFGTSSSGYGMKFSIHAVYTPKAQPIELLGNPYMFTGRRFDLEILRSGSGRTGLYYYRARYYNPEIGRFLQTDPIGYGDGMNWYNYCGNNPVNYLDSTGTRSYTFEWDDDGGFNVEIFDDDENSIYSFHGNDFAGFCYEMSAFDVYFFDDDWKSSQDEGKLWEDSGKTNLDLFWALRMLKHMGVYSGEEYRELGGTGVIINVGGYYEDEEGNKHYNCYDFKKNIVYWNMKDVDLDYGEYWDIIPGIACLAHELDHAHYDLVLKKKLNTLREISAVQRENRARFAIFDHMQWSGGRLSGYVYPRVSYTDPDPYSDQPQNPGQSSTDAWDSYQPGDVVY